MAHAGQTSLDGMCVEVAVWCSNLLVTVATMKTSGTQMSDGNGSITGGGVSNDPGHDLMVYDVAFFTVLFV